MLVIDGDGQAKESMRDGLNALGATEEFSAIVPRDMTQLEFQFELRLREENNG